MAVYKEILPSDIKTATSQLLQLVDVLQEDVSASVSRRRYQSYITGSSNSIGVTSSLFQTVYDSDFTLQTSNPIFDVTFGLNPSGSTVLSSQTGIDAAGKELFPSSSLMMREKIDVYRSMAQQLLGDSDSTFIAPFDSTDGTNVMDVALFIAFKRLFARDSLKRETFAMRFYQTASAVTGGDGTEPSGSQANGFANLNRPSTTGSAIYTDIGAASNKLTAFGGQVGNVVDAANTSRTVGLMFYDRGLLVLDLAKVTSASQFVSGTIDAVTPSGFTTLGALKTETAGKSKFIPDFVVSASMDNVLDHLCGTRFGTGSVSALTFQNQTNVNSTLIFCRAAADESNYSSNPTYTDDDSRIVVIDPGEENSQTSFTYITGVGLYDANDTLLAVAKTSRPIEKSNERDITLRIRLDFAKKRTVCFTSL